MGDLLMNDIQISENKEELTLTTIDIADMMEMPHWQILRKLEGTKKFKGIIQILNDNKIVVVDYFIKSSYTDDKG
jgi:phage regulator Rha-like protein